MKLEKASWIAAILAIPVGIFVWYFKPEDCTAFFKNVGNWIWTPFSVAFHWLAHPVTWPVWALILLAVAGLLIVVGLVYFFTKLSQFGPKEVHFDWPDYKADEIFGVDWIWSYVYQRQLINENSLTAFCPRKKCKNRLTMREDHDRMRIRNYGIGGQMFVPISFTCRNCGFSHQSDLDWKQLKSDVLQEIERRINAQEFRAGVS